MAFSELSTRITELTHEHWDECLQRGSFDYVHDFAGRLPMDVVSELLGVPVADRPQLRRAFNAPVPAFLISGDTTTDHMREAAANGLLLLHKPVSP